METERPDMNHETFLDEVLDASLAAYSRTEPRVGLEARILRRLEEEEPQSRWLGWLGRWQWAAAGAFAVVLVSAAVLLSLRDRSAVPERAQAPVTAPAPTAGEVPPKPAVSAAQVAAVVVPPAVRTPRFNLVRPDVAPIPAAPRMAVFPAPAPLSNEEVLLARTAVTANPVVLEALAHASQAPIQDLEIAPMKIEPLPGSEDVQKEALKETPNPGPVPNP
jgi:hypothetical protein